MCVCMRRQRRKTHKKMVAYLEEMELGEGMTYTFLLYFIFLCVVCLLCFLSSKYIIFQTKWICSAGLLAKIQHQHPQYHLPPWLDIEALH